MGFRRRRVQSPGRILGLNLVVGALAATILMTVGGGSSISTAQAAKKRRTPPCRAAFPGARRKTIGKTTWYNRQESVRMVLCYRFGLEPSAHFPISSAMVCGILAQVIGRRAPRLGVFVDGVCSTADLANDPKEPVKYISAACTWASDVLGALAKPAGVLGSLGCTLAPPAGRFLGSMFESKHEFDVAVDVIRRGKCIKYSPTHFGSPWLSAHCADRDKGFATLPVYRPRPSQPPPTNPGAGPPGDSPPAPVGPSPPSGGSGPGSTYMGLPAIQVSAGYNHVCALQTNGIPYCWGNSLYGATEPPGEQMTELTSGLSFTCGLRLNGTAVCWGWESWPIKAALPPGKFTQLAAGEFHVCGLRSSGEAICWGSNAEGQSAPPAGPFIELDAGGETTCGIRSGGAIDCWGWNNYGQAEPPTGSFREISIGTFAGCGIRMDYSVTCWGGADSEGASPPAETFRQISIGWDASCGLRDDRTVACWNFGSELSGEFTQISAGELFVCGVTVAASVKCVGWPYYGLENPPG